MHLPRDVVIVIFKPHQRSFHTVYWYNAVLFGQSLREEEQFVFGLIYSYFFFENSTLHGYVMIQALLSHCQIQ